MDEHLRNQLYSNVSQCFFVLDQSEKLLNHTKTAGREGIRVRTGQPETRSLCESLQGSDSYSIAPWQRRGEERGGEGRGEEERRRGEGRGGEGHGGGAGAEGRSAEGTTDARPRVSRHRHILTRDSAFVTRL